MKELIELVEARRRFPRIPHVVATVLRVEGSSYRRPGARMLLNIHGRVAGSVSGGCLEKSVITHAREALIDGKARLLTFDTTDQDDLALGSSLGCQGKIWIGIEVLDPDAPWQLEDFVAEVRRTRSPRVLATHIGQHETFSSSLFSQGHNEPDVHRVIRERRSRFVGTNVAGGTLLEYMPPPLALLLFGGNHDVVPMLRVAIELGHEVTIFDRRPDFAVADRFPGALRVIVAQAHEICSHVKPDSRTVAVLMNHHYDTDRDVLAALLPLGLPHIAMLGPKKRTERILSELAEEGHDVETARETIFGPAGLDIGAETPEHIALSVLAEIQAGVAGRQGGHLRQRKAPIHDEVFPYVSCASPASLF